MTRSLHPFQRAFFPDPDVADDQDDEEDQDLQQSEHAECFEPHGPGEKENCFHIEDHEQNRDDVIADGVASAGAVDGVDAALVWHQLGFVRIFRADQLGQQQRDREQRADDSDEDKDGDVVLRHSVAQFSRSS